MLWILASVLFIVWLLGVIKEPMGGFIHFLLFLALLAAGTELALGWRRKHSD
jgi:hypothetical protein